MRLSLSNKLKKNNNIWRLICPNFFPLFLNDFDIFRKKKTYMAGIRLHTFWSILWNSVLETIQTRSVSNFGAFYYMFIVQRGRFDDIFQSSLFTHFFSVVQGYQLISFSRFMSCSIICILNVILILILKYSVNCPFSKILPCIPRSSSAIIKKEVTVLEDVVRLADYVLNIAPGIDWSISTCNSVLFSFGCIKG